MFGERAEKTSTSVLMLSRLFRTTVIVKFAIQARLYYDAARETGVHGLEATAKIVAKLDVGARDQRNRRRSSARA